MSWSNVWDDFFTEKNVSKYPQSDLIRFVSKYFNKSDKSLIKILEVGCGAGVNIWYLTREGFNTYGIDGSKIGIAQAKEKLDRENLNSDLSVGDIIKLPYQDDFFDCVIDNACLCANTKENSKPKNINY